MNAQEKKILQWVKSLSGMTPEAALRERERLATDDPAFAAQVEAVVESVRRADEAADVLASERDALASLASSPRIQHVAQLLSAQDGGRMAQVLVGLGHRSPALAEAIRMAMFAFEDLVYADNRGLQNLIAKVEKTTLRLALRKTEEAVLDRFYSQMSRRASEALREDIEAMGRTRRIDVEDAQRHILRQAKAMIKAGEMVVIKPGEGDEWV